MNSRPYVMCLNDEGAKWDRAAWKSLVRVLLEKLSKGELKLLVRNRGRSRFSKTKRGALEIDYEAVNRDQQLDGERKIRKKG